MKMMNKYFIAVDFDGTLCENAFPEIGKKRMKVIHLLDKIKKKAVRRNLEPVVILWTCRTDVDECDYLTIAVEWCKDNGIHIDYVNENPESPFGDWQRKVLADVYIDDKAIKV